MKTTFYLIFILYFLLFLGAGFVFYTQNIANYGGAKSLPAERVSSGSQIYYLRDKTIARFNPALAEDMKLVKFPQAGDIGRLTLSQTEAFYELKNSQGLWELRRASLEQFASNKIETSAPIFSGFDDFNLPKPSPNNENLAFLGLGKTADAVFTKNLASGKVTKIGDELSARIADFSWNQDGSAILICTSSLTPDTCQNYSLGSSSGTKMFEAEVQVLSLDKTEDIFYLSREETPHLFRKKVVGEAASIDNLSAPKKIVGFELDPTGQDIAYEVVDPETSGSAIYLSDISGANKIQLTSGVNAFWPLFSPDGRQIIYYKSHEGIYLYQIDRGTETKISLPSEQIDRLLGWR